MLDCKKKKSEKSTLLIKKKTLDLYSITLEIIFTNTTIHKYMRHRPSPPNKTLGRLVKYVA